MRLIAVFLFGYLGSGCAQTALLRAPQHDFGEVKQGLRVSHAFVVENTGKAALAIERVEPNIPGIKVRFPAAPVQPGGEANIVVEWNTAKESGESEGAATVFTNDRAAPRQTISFKATVQPRVEFQPFPAFFFTAYRDQAPEKSVRIINHEEQPLVIQRVEAPKRFDVSLKELRAGREYELLLKVKPGSEPGRTTEPVYLYTSNPEHQRLDLNANLFVKADFYAFPEDVAFGSVRVSEIDARPHLADLLTQRTVVTNRGGPVELRSVTSELPFLRIAREPETGASQQFLLKVELDRAKLKPGEYRGLIVVATNDPKHQEISIPVSATVE